MAWSPRTPAADVRLVGVIGTGVIGGGWAAKFLAQGYDVVAWDPGADAEARLARLLDTAWPSLEQLGLARTREAIGGRIASFFQRGTIEEALYEDVESALLTADCGVTASAELIRALRERVRKGERLGGERGERTDGAALAGVGGVGRGLGSAHVARPRRGALRAAGAEFSPKWTNLNSLNHKNFLVRAHARGRAAEISLDPWPTFIF